MSLYSDKQSLAICSNTLDYISIPSPDVVAYCAFAVLYLFDGSIGTRNLEFLSFRFLIPNNGIRNDNKHFHSERSEESKIPIFQIPCLTAGRLVQRADSEWAYCEKVI